MRKVLFYTANGVGLGHLLRTFLIAEELKKKKIKIILVTPARSPLIFGIFFHQLFRLTPLSDSLLAHPEEIRNVRLANCGKFAGILKKIKPDVVVVDVYLTSHFSFSVFSWAIGRFPVKSIFIWRLDDVDKFSKDLINETDKLGYFRKIIFPHDQRELDDLLPIGLLKEIKTDRRFEICGPILRKPDKARMNFCRRKYRISPGDFLITVALGGGGKLEMGKCASAEKITERFLAVYPRLADRIAGLKTVIIVGPYFKKLSKQSLRDLKIVRFEKNLPELMAISDLVISPAGYNMCNELIQAKKPAILIPLLRSGREQFGRAWYLEKKGVAKVFENGSSDDFLKLIMRCRKNLSMMASNFKKFAGWKQGNKKAARIILNELTKK